MNIVVFSGAGISAESGIPTFRDSNGMWKNYDAQKLASVAGFEEDPQAVLDFYNARRKNLLEVEPNDAHRFFAELEKWHDVTIVTQNVDNLHERAGSTNVIHLHGELSKVTSSRERSNPAYIKEYPLDTPIKIGDKAADGSQLRPYIVWFGEYLDTMDVATQYIRNADMFIVVGTSLVVYPAAGLVDYAPDGIPKYLIDPNDQFDRVHSEFKHIKATAVEGVKILSKDIPVGSVPLKRRTGKPVANLINGASSAGKVKMLGALVGDIIGSMYEFNNVKTTNFNLFYDFSTFTDDSVMTLAVAKWLLEDEVHTIHYLIYCMQELGDHHPNAGYGTRFAGWLEEDNPQPYNSWGNGAGMRVSPVGLYARTLDEALALAALTASVSHNHPEGVKGAQAIAACVFLCKEGKNKQEIKECVERLFDYDLDRKIAEIRPNYDFDVSCQGSVPEAIIAFLEGNSFEEVIRLAISLGGDSDTIACMAGAIAACCYEIPHYIAERCDVILTEDLKEIKDKFIEFIEKR